MPNLPRLFSFAFFALLLVIGLGLIQTMVSQQMKQHSGELEKLVLAM